MSSVMTLTEYLNQAEPAYMPIVKLTEDEYIVLDRYIHCKGRPQEEERVVIEIKQYPQYTYLQRGIDKRLYCVKDDGSCNSQSCFWIN